MVKVSIIVPVYNVEKYLKRCLDSLVNQTMQDIEIILVNDASPDNSGEVMEEYRGRYPGLVKCIYLKENVRLGGARNRGMEIATGIYVSFVDSDDWIDLGYIEKLYKKAESTGSDIVYSDYMMVSGKKMESRPNMYPQLCGRQDGIKHKANLLFSGAGACACIIKRVLLTGHNLYFPEKMVYEDMAICPVFTYYAEHPEKAEGTYYYYYQRQDSITHSADQELQKEEAKAVLMLLDECNKRNITNKYPVEVEALFTKYFYAWGMYGIYNGKFPELPEEYMQYLAEEMQRQFPEYRKNPYLYGNIEPGLIQYMYDNDERWLGIPQPAQAVSYHNYYNNSQIKLKLEEMYEVLSNMKVALWGAGKKGREFLEACGSKCPVGFVIDKNEKLSGIKLGTGQLILTPDEGLMHAEVVLVVNKNYYESIKYTIKTLNNKTKLINMDIYLLSGFSVNECIE